MHIWICMQFLTYIFLATDETEIQNEIEGDKLEDFVFLILLINKY